ncbi:MAG: hypothetical protein E7Z68_06170 [Thermoplasmata archaeon]|jgi:hypothetical protein|nr:hypothetical protein [Thermoplasmata archaeon]
MDLTKILPGKSPGKRARSDSDRKPEPPPAALSGGALIINCSRCMYAPDPGTAECIRCMVATMCSVGSTDRIVLRTGKDMEISGRSGKIVKDTASVMRWSFPQEEEKGRCRMCELSRKKVMDDVWDSFPKDTIVSAEARLQGKHPQGKDCDMCILRTRRALEQIDLGLKDISERMSEAAGRPLR